jgi:hypothetical protein
MLKRFWMVPVLCLALLLGGCGAGTAARRGVAPRQPSAAGPVTGLTEVVRTTVPVGTLAAATPALVDSYPAYPAAEDPPVVDGAYPAPGQGEEAPAGSQPFQDCARTPGLAGCGAQAFPLVGRLAIFDLAAGRLIVLDLQGGEGWQTHTGPGRLSWSPDGEYLLLVNESEGGARYELWSADGLPLPALAVDGPARWQPDGSLSGVDTAVSARGDRARLERIQEGSWVVHVRPAGGEEQALPLTPALADEVFLLRDWLPGGERLLAQRAFASGAALQEGGELVVVDAQTGQVQGLEITAPLDESAGLAWNPSQPLQLALLASGGGAGERGGVPGLALVDFNSGQKSAPLPEDLRVSGLSWRPDGERLAIAVEAVGDLATNEGKDVLDGPGIFLLDPQTGGFERITQPPPGAQDGWPRWSAGGTLVFARLLSDELAGPLVEVRARQVDTGQESVLFQGLAAEPRLHGALDWASFLGLGEK